MAQMLQRRMPRDVDYLMRQVQDEDDNADDDTMIEETQRRRPPNVRRSPPNVDQLLSQAEDLRVELLKEAEALDTQYNSVKIARIVGSSLSAAGSLAAIAGAGAVTFALCTPLAPAVLAAVASGVSVVGGLTSSGAQVICEISERTTVNQLQAKWNTFQRNCRQLKQRSNLFDTAWSIGKVTQEVLKEGGIITTQVEGVVELFNAASRSAEDTVKAATKIAEQAAEVTSTAAKNVTEGIITGRMDVAVMNITPAAAKPAVNAAEQAMKNASSVTKASASLKTTAQASKEVTKRSINVVKAARANAKVAQNAARVAGRAAKTATKAANTAKTASKVADRISKFAKSPIVLANVASLGFSIYDIVNASIELHKKTKAKAGDLLRQLAQDLELLISEVQGACVDFE